MSKVMVRTIKGWFEVVGEDKAYELAKRGFFYTHRKTYYVIVSDGTRAYAVTKDAYAKFFRKNEERG